MDEEERKSKGYEDKKEFMCISCGKTVLATKFASKSKVQCDECKAAKMPPNEEILIQIEAESKTKKSRSRTEKAVNDDGDGETKLSHCINCGAEVHIGKFASHSKTLCDNCRAEGYKASKEMSIDLSKVDRTVLPSMDELYILPTVIANPLLRQVQCPACHHEYMKIIKILDCSPDLGLVLVYQCENCLTGITLSEQCLQMLRPQPISNLFNYRAEELSILDGMEDTRSKNLIGYLVGLLKKHDIPIEGVKLPPYLNRHEYKAHCHKNEIGFTENLDGDGK